MCDIRRCAERLRWSALDRREHKTPVAPKESDLVLQPTKIAKEESGLPVKLPLQGRWRDARVEDACTKKSSGLGRCEKLARTKQSENHGCFEAFHLHKKQQGALVTVVDLAKHTEATPTASSAIDFENYSVVSARTRMWNRKTIHKHSSHRA